MSLGSRGTVIVLVGMIAIVAEGSSEGIAVSGLGIHEVIKNRTTKIIKWMFLPYFLISSLYKLLI